jgi:hypothetical protein
MTDIPKEMAPFELKEAFVNEKKGGGKNER